MKKIYNSYGKICTKWRWRQEDTSPLSLDVASLVAYPLRQSGDLVLVLGGELRQQLPRLLVVLEDDTRPLQIRPRQIVYLHAETVLRVDLLGIRVAKEG